MSSRVTWTFRTVGLALVIALLAGIVFRLAIPWLILGLGIWGAAALGIRLGERARVIQRRNST
jgi:hypothetical protein